MFFAWYSLSQTADYCLYDCFTPQAKPAKAWWSFSASIWRIIRLEVAFLYSLTTSPGVNSSKQWMIMWIWFGIITKAYNLYWPSIRPVFKLSTNMRLMTSLLKLWARRDALEVMKYKWSGSICTGQVEDSIKNTPLIGWSLKFYYANNNALTGSMIRFSWYRRIADPTRAGANTLTRSVIFCSTTTSVLTGSVIPSRLW